MCSSFVEPYGWAFLPDLLLEEIFSQLPIKNLGRCSQVCLNWYRISQQGYAWRRFQYKDKMFTRRKYTSHAGWQYMIDHWKLRFLIVKATSKWRVLEIEPVTILFNLYEFIRVLTNFSEYYERNSSEKPLQGIRSFSFKWQLHVHVRGENETERVFGTGGEMLKSLSSLLSHLHGLTELSLQELQLEPYECNDFIDDILYKFDSQLISLCIINLTKVYRPFLQLGLFLFLEHLTVSPQHLDESIVILLADLRHLKSLIILQNDKTFGAKAVDSKAWLSFAERNNHTRVYLIQAGKRQNALLIQPKAPVYAIIFDKSTGQLTGELTQEICHNYSTTLQFFLQKGLERRYRSREFSKRVDIFAIELAHRCPNLKLLAIRERMCFASALLLAQIARSHRMTICLRRNALLKRVNWSDDAVRSILGSESNQKWIRGHCRNFETLEKTIRNIMGTTAPIVTDNRYLYSF
ncbi:F-box-like family protein [Acanthocheilonema viteae]